MAAFTLTGLFVSIVLAFVTSVVVAPAVTIIFNTANQHLFASIKSANMSAPSLAGPSGVTSLGSSMQQDILLDTAGSTTFVLTTPAEPANSTANVCSNAISIGLMAPLFDTTESHIRSASTPVLEGQSAENSVPALNLDKVHIDTPLITASPYTQNEGLTFSKGTPLWQPQAGIKPTLQAPSKGPPAIISECSFAKNEGLKFAAGTSLITSSPHDCNETVTFPKGTLLWQPRAKATDRTGCLTHFARSCMRFFACALSAAQNKSKGVGEASWRALVATVA